MKEKVLVAASVASMIDQFNMPNIKLLLELGYEVHVACNFREGNTCDRIRIHKLQKTLDQLQVLWHPWDCPRSILPVWKCERAYRQMCRLVRKHRFAWIHCHSPIGGALARMAAHGSRIRVIYTAHGFHFYRGAPLKNWMLYYPLEKMLSYWTDVLVTVNQEDYRFAKQHLRAENIYKIPGVGIDVGRYQADKADEADEAGLWQQLLYKGFRERFCIPEDAVLLLSVGELSRRKNHQAVISVLKDLPGQDVYYMICGQGAWKERLEQYAKKYGVFDRVRMTGYLEDTASAYHNADLFVFPSLQEGMPVALMEAMAAGLPCAVSDIRGNRELIGESGGGRFGPKDRGQLCQLLNSLLSDQKRREACGQYNRRHICKYDIKKVNKKMRRIYLVMKNEKSTGSDVSL